MMDRRRFLLTSLAGALTAPLGVGAQQRERIWRIGWLAEQGDPGRDSQEPGGGRWFVEALQELGSVSGQNLQVEYQFAKEQAEVLPELAGALVRSSQYPELAKRLQLRPQLRPSRS